MPKRALIGHRPWLLGAWAAAIAFYFLRDDPVGGVWLILLKGAAVALLAVYVAQRAREMDAALLVFALALGSLGDMGMELSMAVGGGLFLLAHLLAIAFYLRHRRQALAPSQGALAIVILVVTPLTSFLAGAMNWAFALYGAVLGVMAAAAWTSAFPRYRVGLGAVLFVISDWLIFAREGIPETRAIADALVWPLYFLGQFLIAVGVVQSLRAKQRALGAQSA